MENKRKKLAIIGFGNQAKSWALNLRDSGYEITVILRPESGSIGLAKKMGFQVQTLESDLSNHNSFAVLIPDNDQSAFFNKYSHQFTTDSLFLYAHGHSLVSEKINEKYPQFQHALFAPKAIASELRFQYETKGGLGAVYSVELVNNKEKIQDQILELAKDLGINCGPYEVMIQDETFADLFSEQSILCSVLPYVSLEIFNKLRKKGIKAELCYFEAWYEVKLIADTLMKVGPEKFFELISPNALIGAQKGREILLNEEFNNNLDQLLEEIYSGQFFSEIKESNYDELKKQTLGFWKGQELSQVHKKFENHLYQ